MFLGVMSIVTNQFSKVAYRPKIEVHFGSFQGKISLHIVVEFIGLLLSQVLLGYEYIIIGKGLTEVPTLNIS